MNEKWWRWRKRSEWDEFFKEFDKLEKMVDDMMHEIKEEDVPREPKERPFSNPYVFGFSVSVGPDGKPQVQRFGALQSHLQGTKVQQGAEPLVDVMNDKREVVVTAELPGLSMEDIKLDASDAALRISVETPERNYYKKLYLPAKVQSDSMRTSYKNGVLEIRLKKLSGRLISVKRRLSPNV